MLSIKSLTVNIEKQTILDQINLSVKSGQTHIIMGPNGSGKSTLAKTIMGSPECRVEGGFITFNKKKLLKLSSDKRSKLGIFLANQYPMEIPGVNYEKFLHLSFNSHTKKKLTPSEFHKILTEKIEMLRLKPEFLERNLNQGFSGGEKKKSEILQLMILNPKLAILDEADSGLDIDALRNVFSVLKQEKKENKQLSLLIITHNDRILDHIKPDKIHIMAKGQIVKSGSSSLLNEIKKTGFKKIIQEN